jgi:hypothetical protein
MYSRKLSSFVLAALTVIVLMALSASSKHQPRHDKQALDSANSKSNLLADGGAPRPPVPPSPFAA